MAELLVWPALLGYGEAAVALVGEARRPGLAGRLAIWGVRVGWLAQTGLLVAQAAQADGFPWSSWSGALNLLAWLVVGGYLVWGCRPRFRLVGIGVMPLAALLLGLAYAGGGIDGEGDHPGVLLGAHVALMLGAFAGFALAAGTSGLFLWHERRLKRHEPTVLRVRVPPLDALDRLAARTTAVSLAALAAGVAFGAARLVSAGGGVDVAMGATVGAGVLYAAVLIARGRRGLRGRRAALANLAGFVAVLVLLSVTHFA